jgi:hypothetical protein
MLELKDQKAKLASVNPRAENHGDEKKPAVDLKFETTCASDVLIPFHPELRATVFKKPDQPDLLNQDDEPGLTALRFPSLGPLKWDWEGVNYNLTVDYGLGGDSDIELEDCKVDGVRFEPLNGGSVTVTFRVIAHPDEGDTGKLCQLIQQDTVISLVKAAEKQEAIAA